MQTKPLVDFDLTPEQHRALDVLMAEAVEIMLADGGKHDYMWALTKAKDNWNERIVRIYAGNPTDKDRTIIRLAGELFHAKMLAASRAEGR